MSSRASAPQPAVAVLGRERWLFLAGLAAFALALALRRLGDFDLPWHLATGRFITALRGIPKFDPLSFTHHRLTYVEPLTDVPLYWLAVTGGAPALQITGGIVGAAIGFALYLQLRSTGPIVYAASGLALAGMYSWLVVRPATLSFLLIAVMLGAIELHRASAECRRGTYLLIAIPVGVLLWANAHGFATIGAGLFVCYAIYRLACRMAQGRLGRLLPQQDGTAAVATASAALGTVVAATLNVAGPTLRLGPNRFSSSPTAVLDFSANTEFVPPSLDFFLHWQPIGVIVAMLALLGLIVGRDVLHRRGCPNAFDIGCWVAGVVALLWMVRTVPIAVLILTPIMARRLATTVPSTAITRWGLASCSWLAAGFALLEIDTSLGFGFEPRHFPERAVAFIKREQPRGHLWNFSPYGGYLAWRLFPEHLVFMDGRNDQAHATAEVLKSAAALSDPQQFAELMTEFDMQYAVMNAKDGEPFGMPLSQSAQWTMVEFDDVAAVYVRNAGPNAALAKRGYRILRHLTALSEVLNVAFTGGRLAPWLRDDGRLAAAQDPASARAAFIDACGELAMRDFEAFERALLRLAMLAPEHPAIAVLTQMRISLQQ